MPLLGRCELDSTGVRMRRHGDSLESPPTLTHARASRGCFSPPPLAAPAPPRSRRRRGRSHNRDRGGARLDPRRRDLGFRGTRSDFPPTHSIQTGSRAAERGHLRRSAAMRCRVIQAEVREPLAKIMKGLLRIPRRSNPATKSSAKRTMITSPRACRRLHHQPTGRERSAGRRRRATAKPMPPCGAPFTVSDQTRSR